MNADLYHSASLTSSSIWIWNNELSRVPNPIPPLLTCLDLEFDLSPWRLFRDLCRLRGRGCNGNDIEPRGILASVVTSCLKALAYCSEALSVSSVMISSSGNASRQSHTPGYWTVHRQSVNVGRARFSQNAPGVLFYVGRDDDLRHTFRTWTESDEIIAVCNEFLDFSLGDLLAFIWHGTSTGSLSDGLASLFWITSAVPRHQLS